MNNKFNLYFPNYQRIEQEVITISSFIQFNDNQANVYSSVIADLIMRCSADLESIAKDLYRNIVKKEPSITGECFNWLEQQFKLSDKCLFVVCPNFNFNKYYSPKLQPFNYIDKSDDDYYSHYNAIKHDRIKNLEKANINILIRLLGALFILNLYYKNDFIFLGDDCYGKNIDKSMGSKIFNILIYPSDECKDFTYNKDICSNECIYKIIKDIGEFSILIKYEDSTGKIKSNNSLMVNEHFQNFCKENFNKIITEAKYFSLLNKYYGQTSSEIKNLLYGDLKIKKIISLKVSKLKDSYKCILNV